MKLKLITEVNSPDVHDLIEGVHLYQALNKQRKFILAEVVIESGSADEIVELVKEYPTVKYSTTNTETAQPGTTTRGSNNGY